MTASIPSYFCRLRFKRFRLVTRPTASFAVWWSRRVASSRKSDIVLAFHVYKENIGKVSVCCFLFVRATSPGYLWKVHSQAYGLTGRFSSQFIPCCRASRAVSFTCFYVSAFFAHATLLRRQRERSSLSSLADLLSSSVPPVIRQSVFGTWDGRRPCVVCSFTTSGTWLGGPFYRSCLHGR